MERAELGVVVDQVEESGAQSPLISPNPNGNPILALTLSTGTNPAYAPSRSG